MGDKGKRWGGKRSVDIGSKEVNVEAPGWPWESHSRRSWLSERDKACVSSAQQHIWKRPRGLLSTSRCTAGAKDLLCLPKRVKTVNVEAQPSSV